MSYLHYSFKPSQLIRFAIVVVFSVLLAMQSVYIYESYKIRQQVIKGLTMATPAKAVVEKNASKGVALDDGWVSPTSIDGVLIRVAQNNGAITIMYGANVDGGGRSLNLVPVLSGHAGAYAYKGDEKSSSILIPAASQVSWVCASAATMTSNSAVLELKGTLPTKYAPLECRLNLEDYAK